MRVLKEKNLQCPAEPDGRRRVGIEIDHARHKSFNSNLPLTSLELAIMQWLRNSPHQQALSIEELQVLCRESPLRAQADALVEAINSLEKTGWIDKVAGRYALNEERNKSVGG